MDIKHSTKKKFNSKDDKRKNKADGKDLMQKI